VVLPKPSKPQLQALHSCPWFGGKFGGKQAPCCLDVYLDAGRTCGGFERPKTRNFVALEEILLPDHRQNDVNPRPHIARFGKAVHGGQGERLRLPWISGCGKVAEKLFIRDMSSVP